MAKFPKIIPVTDLRQDAAAVLRRVRESREPLIITQRSLSLSQRRRAAAAPAEAVFYVGSARSRISGPAVSRGHHRAL
ncbi:MAG: type II toxin-antitoxin system Phd/YefM family antitoxin [Acidobacteria bacterium]|nr:MAG: type II toxin-antitoxin system Phd/YefM family antitoxin [Acidobacteriota bacterium]